MAFVSVQMKPIDCSLGETASLWVGAKVKSALYYNEENKVKYNKTCQRKFSPSILLTDLYRVGKILLSKNENKFCSTRTAYKD